jgi:RHS repeat-associated protein
MLGQRTSLTSNVPSQGLSAALTKYYYDNLYQLTKVDYPTAAPWNGEVHSWTYDAIGNRLTNTVNSTTQTYTYEKIGSNPLNWQWMLSDGVNTYSYQGTGATLSKSGPSGNFSFAWNTEVQLTGISGAETASYGYDYQGRRRSKTVGGVTTRYLYDGLNLIGELGTSPADYLFGPGIDEPIAMSRGGQVSYYASDALGSVNALTNTSGTVQNTYLYDAWGQTRTQTGSLVNPFTYTARETGEAGSLFYRARYLSPTVGRFLAEDEVRWISPSLYAYVDNSPTQKGDPLGLFGVGVGIHIGLRIGCGEAVYHEFKFLSQAGAPRYAHCITSCEIAKRCGGRLTAVAGGVAKEFLDLAACLRTGNQRACDTAFQPSDTVDNAAGYTCPTDTPCEIQCQHLDSFGDGPPGPFRSLGRRRR